MERRGKEKGSEKVDYEVKEGGERVKDGKRGEEK